MNNSAIPKYTRPARQSPRAWCTLWLTGKIPSCHRYESQDGERLKKVVGTYDRAEPESSWIFSGFTRRRADRAQMDVGIEIQKFGDLLEVQLTLGSWNELDSVGLTSMKMDQPQIQAGRLRMECRRAGAE